MGDRIPQRSGELTQSLATSQRDIPARPTLLNKVGQRKGLKMVGEMFLPRKRHQAEKRGCDLGHDMNVLAIRSRVFDRLEVLPGPFRESEGVRSGCKNHCVGDGFGQKGLCPVAV